MFVCCCIIQYLGVAVFFAHATWHKPEVCGSYALLSSDFRLLQYFPLSGSRSLFLLFFAGDRKKLQETVSYTLCHLACGFKHCPKTSPSHSGIFLTALWVLLPLIVLPLEASTTQGVLGRVPHVVAPSTLSFFSFVFLQTAKEKSRKHQRLSDTVPWSLRPRNRTAALP